MNREKGIWVIAVLLVFVCVLSGCGGGEEPEKEVSLPVSVTAVEKGDLVQTTTIPAVIEGNMVVDIMPKMTGRVAAVYVEEGQNVKAGQHLAQLETSELEIQLKQAQAAVVSAKNGLAQARSAIKQAEVSYNTAKSNFERIEALYNQEIISQQDYDNAKLQYEIAKSTYEAAQQQTKVDPATGYQYLEATVKQAQASVDLINQSLTNARIVSPIAGTVTGRFINPGEIGTGVAFTVVDMNTVKATAKITQKNIAKFKVGQEVKVSISAVDMADNTYKITKLVPASDNTKTYTLEVNIPNPKHSIKPGMTASIVAVTNEIKDVMILPRDTVVERGGRSVVYLLDGDKVKAVTVETGEYTDEFVEIKRGLKVGDKVVSDGQHLLSDGDSVTVTGGGDAK
jgi:HlyD family secretion protein